MPQQPIIHQATSPNNDERNSNGNKHLPLNSSISHQHPATTYKKSSLRPKTEPQRIKNNIISPNTKKKSSRKDCNLFPLFLLLMLVFIVEGIFLNSQNIISFYHEQHYSTTSFQEKIRQAFQQIERNSMEETSHQDSSTKEKNPFKHSFTKEETPLKNSLANEKTSVKDGSSTNSSPKNEKQAPSDPLPLLATKAQNSNSFKQPNPEKEPWRKLIQAAGNYDVFETDYDTYKTLPDLTNVTKLYGSSVQVHGLETCKAYQALVEPFKRQLAPAGMFNTGTNLMMNLLATNCYIPERVKYYGHNSPGIRFQVPWGKHNPVSFRLKHTARQAAKGVIQKDVLPIVMIKDPYSWMGSLCRHHYAALWKHTPKHCPNLIANKHDASFENGKIIPVMVNYSPENKTSHESILHFWNEWNKDYFNITHFPRIIVRFEDLLFRTEETVQIACECAGGKLHSEKFRYVMDNAKEGQPAHRGANGLIESLVKYGSLEFRQQGFTEDDLEFVREIVDMDLMDRFGYKLV